MHASPGPQTLGDGVPVPRAVQCLPTSFSRATRFIRGFVRHHSDRRAVPHRVASLPELNG